MAEERSRRPASQYYWGDWWKDKALQSCSQPARGLWHEMNTLQHEGEPYGHLTLNGKPMTPTQLANLCRISVAKCKQLLDELESNGVFSRSEAGAIYSRRMVRDELTRETRAEGGKAGAEHGAKGAAHGAKGGRPRKLEGGLETPLTTVGNPPPSSSSSSATSSSDTNSVPDGTGGTPPPAAPSPTPTAAPAAAPPTDREMVFATGVPLLTAAGVVEKNARSMLAMLSRKHGEAAVAQAIVETARDHAGEPVSWLQAILNGKGGGRAVNRQEALEQRNRQTAVDWAAQGQGEIHEAT